MRLSPALDRFLASVPFAALVLGHLWLVPLWDGMEYAQCVLDALRPGHSLAQLNCFGHPVVAYTGPLALAALASYGSYVPFLLVNLALGVLACASFHRISELLAPGADRRVERALATAAFGIAPAFAAASLNLTPDYAVCAFFLATVAALLDKRFLRATLFGTALVLSKEPGVVLFAGAAALEALLDRAPWKSRLRSRLVLLAPFAAFAAMRAIQSATQAGATWTSVAARAPLFDLLFGLTFDRHLEAYAFLMFAFQFQWLASLAGLGIFARIRERTSLFALGLVVLVFYACTRFVTFANTRYLLCMVPVLLLAAIAGLGAVRVRAARIGVVAGFFAASLASLWQPADPVSRSFFGTFAMGDARFFDMTSFTGECCGHGRDQLAYNLQFTGVHRVLDVLLRELAPTVEAPIILPHDANWFVLAQIDPETHARTLRPPPDPKGLYLLPENGIQRPSVDRPWETTTGVMTGTRPKRAFFVGFPNVEFGPDVKALRKLYEVRSTRTFRSGDDSLEVAELGLR